MSTTPGKNPKWLGEGLNEETIAELSRVDDAPRKSTRGTRLRVSDECGRTKHRECSSRFCVCDCHAAKMYEPPPGKSKAPVIVASAPPVVITERTTISVPQFVRPASVGAPVITIFVRHHEKCKYRGDEFAKRCDCRKHLRWTHNGKQHRLKTGTRSWADAEAKKREIEDQLAGKTPIAPEPQQQTIARAVELFLMDKKAQGVTSGVVYKYAHELGRFQAFCDADNVLTPDGITRELLTRFAATWETTYPRSLTRGKVRERLRSFLRYCNEARWITSVPPLPKIQIEYAETQPLTPDEYERLLDATYLENGQQAKLHAFIQCMRWSGLSLQDALQLKKSALQLDAGKRFYRISTRRMKTGTHVAVPIPPDVARELLDISKDHAVYIFWPGEKYPAEYARRKWAIPRIQRLFENAKITQTGFMKSHRLRDTFAVSLLEKGVPMEEVSRLLGHTSIKTTEKYYAKWSKGRQDRLDNLVTGTWGD